MTFWWIHILGLKSTKILFSYIFGAQKHHIFTQKHGLEWKPMTHDLPTVFGSNVFVCLSLFRIHTLGKTVENDGKHTK